MNVLTFDIEEWYIYELYPKGGKNYYLPILESLLGNLLKILDERSIKATFFCLGIIAREYPEVIKEIVARGHEIGCHSDKHQHCDRFKPYEFEEDLKRAVASLEDLIDKKIVSFRAPAFSISDETKWAFEILAKNGIRNDCSVFPAKRSDGGYYNFKYKSPVLIKTGINTLYELPVNIARILSNNIPFSGGGYFRLLPYPVINLLMKRSNYVMSYFHLRDFDTKQKEVISPRYFKSYYGIKKMLPKLEQFLTDFQFMPVRDAVEILKIQGVKETVL